MTPADRSDLGPPDRLAVVALHAASIMIQLAARQLALPVTAHNSALSGRLVDLKNLIGAAVDHQTQAYIALRQGRYTDAVDNTDAAVKAATSVLDATRTPRPRPQPGPGPQRGPGRRGLMPTDPGITETPSAETGRATPELS
jgi:hypothetical protein